VEYTLLIRISFSYSLFSHTLRSPTDAYTKRRPQHSGVHALRNCMVCLAVKTFLFHAFYIRTRNSCPWLPLTPSVIWSSTISLNIIGISCKEEKSVRYMWNLVHKSNVQIGILLLMLLLLGWYQYLLHLTESLGCLTVIAMHDQDLPLD